MTKERRLGRGLEALLGHPLPLPSEPPANRIEPASFAASSAAPPLEARLGEIDNNPFQPRREFDPAEIQQLAASISAHGLLQPIVVRRVDERFQLIAGERRLRAAAQLGWAEVPVRIIEADDRQVAEVAIVENLQRKDLNPLEKAAAFQDYLARYKCSQDELAGRIGADRSTVANLIRLLELPGTVQDAIRAGSISAGHARALLPLGEESEQVSFCRRIQAENLSVRQTEQLVREQIAQADREPLSLITGDGESVPASPARSPHLSTLEQQFRTALGAKVDVRQGAKGSGRIVVHFKNHDEFDRLRAALCGTPTSARQVG